MPNASSTPIISDCSSSYSFPNLIIEIGLFIIALLVSSIGGYRILKRSSSSSSRGPIDVKRRI